MVLRVVVRDENEVGVHGVVRRGVVVHDEVMVHDEMLREAAMEPGPSQRSLLSYKWPHAGSTKIPKECR